MVGNDANALLVNSFRNHRNKEQSLSSQADVVRVNDSGNSVLFSVVLLGKSLYIDAFFVVAGGAARCAGNRLCLPCHGHRGRCRGCLERGAVLGTKELQSPGGQDPAGLREPHTAGTSQHRQVPQILDRYSQRQASGKRQKMSKYVMLTLNCTGYDYNSRISKIYLGI